MEENIRDDAEVEQTPNRKQPTRWEAFDAWNGRIGLCISQIFGMLFFTLPVLNALAPGLFSPAFQNRSLLMGIGFMLLIGHIFIAWYEDILYRKPVEYAFTQRFFTHLPGDDKSEIHQKISSLTTKEFTTERECSQALESACSKLTDERKKELITLAGEKLSLRIRIKNCFSQTPSRAFSPEGTEWLTGLILVLVALFVFFFRTERLTWSFTQTLFHLKETQVLLTTPLFNFLEGVLATLGLQLIFSSSGLRHELLANVTRRNGGDSGGSPSPPPFPSPDIMQNTAGLAAILAVVLLLGFFLTLGILPEGTQATLLHWLESSFASACRFLQGFHETFFPGTLFPPQEDGSSQFSGIAFIMQCLVIGVLASYGFTLAGIELPLPLQNKAHPFRDSGIIGGIAGYIGAILGLIQPGLRGAIFAGIGGVFLLEAIRKSVKEGIGEDAQKGSSSPQQTNAEQEIK